MKKILFKRIAAFTALILWMAVIFAFSAQTGERSEEESGKVIESVAEFVISDYGDFTPAQKEQLRTEWRRTVRKTAHFTEYAILASLAFAAASTLPVKGQKRFFGCLIFSAFYACTDEIHQMFVADRAGQLRDVLIDSAGALFGLAAVTAIVYLRHKHKRRTPV